MTKARTKGRGDRLDPGLGKLCRAMNRIPNIRTVESCSGHGVEPLSVYFEARDLSALGFLALVLRPRRGWLPWVRDGITNQWSFQIRAMDTDAPPFVLFQIHSGPFLGKEARIWANRIATQIEELLDNKTVMKMFS